MHNTQVLVKGDWEEISSHSNVFEKNISTENLYIPAAALDIILPLGNVEGGT